MRQAFRPHFAPIFVLLFTGLFLGAATKKPRQVKSSANPSAYAAFSRRLTRSEQYNHALNRLTFGPKPGDYEALEQIGLDKWIQNELYPEKILEESSLESRLLPLQALWMNTRDIYIHYSLNANELSDLNLRKLASSVAPRNVVASELAEGKLLRAVYSTHQLQELLVDFWYNHFNVFLNKGADRYMVPAYEREAIRPHVFGKFYDLLLATAKSPAMLFYLDNWQSVSPEAAERQAQLHPRTAKRGLNENYGRELLELHTLGVDGGYTQKDVIEVARCFTGWTIAHPRQEGEFEYNDKVHDGGRKVVLGHVIPEGGGMNDGLKVLDILAHHPSTARFISRKLAQRFVADDPPPSLVMRMTQTFMESDGDLQQVVRTMVTSPEFWSQGAYNAKIKTPFEMVVSALRATNADIFSTIALSNELQKLGEPLYRKIEPTGYSSANAEWVSSAGLLERMNFALALAHNRVPGVKVYLPEWQGQDNPTQLARSLLSQDPSEQTCAAIQKMLDDPALQKQLASNARAGSPQIPSLIAGLVLGSPEFQHR